MRRPRWWEEIAVVLLGYWLYALIRNGVPTQAEAALQRAGEILGLERALRIAIEPPVNAFVASVEWLAVACNYYYATLHFLVTIAVLVWLYVAHPLRYRAIRSVLFATNLVALVGFWAFALAPPRMLSAEGFVDTVVFFHTWGSWASGDVANASNQYAAMPSLHIGWSLWCGLVLLALARRGWVRVLGAAYPALTLVVVVATANHFVLDAVGGALALAGGFGVQRLLSGRPAFATPPRMEPAASPG